MDQTEFSAIAIANRQIYIPCGLKLSALKAEAESKDYSAHVFCLDQFVVRYRMAKITPTKIGQFVTTWKRDERGQTAPFASTDQLDFIIIATYTAQYAGQFIFPKAVLITKGIISSTSKNGKRGIRVYPPWDIALNKQARQTQEWQLNYFIDHSHTHDMAIDRAREIFKNAK